MRRLRLALGVVAAALVALTQTAAAATVSVHVRRAEGLRTGRIEFTAASGEANRLTISASADDVVFRDSGASIRARGDCRLIAANQASCPRTEDEAYVDLGDGDDRATVTPQLPAVVRGGTGDDVLVGGPGPDAFAGGPGADVLRGGADADQLTGGAGRDRLIGGTGDDRLVDGESDRQAAPDVFDGGPNEPVSDATSGDTVDYSPRHHDLQIDLGHGRTGGEDRLVGIEGVTAGSGDDRLIGDARANLLSGGTGDDVLRGGAGDDVENGGGGDDRLAGDAGQDSLLDGAGSDRLSGGAGPDSIFTRERGASPAGDRIDCGGGADEVSSDSRDTLDRSCELVQAGANSVVAALPTINAAGATFRLICRSDGYPDHLCHGRIVLTGRRGGSLGRTHYDVGGSPAGDPVMVPLTPAGRVAFRTGEIVRVDLVPEGEDAAVGSFGYRMAVRLGPQAVRAGASAATPPRFSAPASVPVDSSIELVARDLDGDGVADMWPRA